MLMNGHWGEAEDEACTLEEAEPLDELTNQWQEEILSQRPKGIMVDETEYFPVHDDWALGYADIGGEG